MAKKIGAAGMADRGLVHVSMWLTPPEAASLDAALEALRPDEYTPREARSKFLKRHGLREAEKILKKSGKNA